MLVQGTVGRYGGTVDYDGFSQSIQTGALEAEAGARLHALAGPSFRFDLEAGLRYGLSTSDTVGSLTLDPTGRPGGFGAAAVTFKRLQLQLRASIDVYRFGQSPPNSLVYGPRFYQPDSAMVVWSLGLGWLFALQEP